MTVWHAYAQGGVRAASALSIKKERFPRETLASAARSEGLQDVAEASGMRKAGRRPVPEGDERERANL